LNPFIKRKTDPTIARAIHAVVDLQRINPTTFGTIANFFQAKRIGIVIAQTAARLDGLVYNPTAARLAYDLNGNGEM
jgi:hypothetical protein